MPCVVLTVAWLSLMFFKSSCNGCGPVALDIIVNLVVMDVVR